MREIHLHATAATRSAAQLDGPSADLPDPALSDLVAALVSEPAELPVVVRGGEPTLRSDLPALLEALAPRRPVLCTDGLPLGSAPRIGALRQSGMAGLRVLLHSSRADAHDWLVGRQGAWKASVRALRVAGEAGLPIEVQATVTRPTAAHLAELVQLAASVGARAVHLRRLLGRGHAASSAVMLVPRFALLAEPLEAAAVAAQRAKLDLRLSGFPVCVAPRLRSRIAGPDAIRHLGSPEAAWRRRLAEEVPETVARCGACPDLPRCAGAPADYVERFGLAEILSEAERPERERGAAPALLAPPPPRAGRAPTTRRRAIHAIAARGGVEGDPLVHRPDPTVPALRIHLFDAAGAPWPTRILRSRLVRAAQEGAQVLRIVGRLGHPAAAEILREGARLPGVRVEVAGEVEGLEGLTDAEIYELRGLGRLDAALLRADALPAVLDRVRAIAGIEVGAFAILAPDADLGSWSAAWGAGAIPGAPAARLGSRGASLREIAGAAEALSPGPFREAVARLLPRCLCPSALPPPEAPGPLVTDRLEIEGPVQDSEPAGAFDPCACGLPSCPGVARGWRRE